MPAKTPMYLKTTTPKKGKKLRLRDVLSGDMISPPLGDVRHSAHVGPEGEGDMFGDVAFLRGKMSMLPAAVGVGMGRAANGRSHSVERHDEHDDDPDGLGGGLQHSHDYSYNGYHYQHASSGLLKTTVSMPVFVHHEQAPPKPPRLHLDDPSPPSRLPPQQQGHLHHGQQQQQQQVNHRKQANGHAHTQLGFLQNGSMGVPASNSCHRDISLSPTIRKLVPSSGSFSEASSEDSMSESCGPLDVRRGLSLDSDAGLSNEDLRSERSESPCSTFQTGGLGTGAAVVPRADSMMGLDLDLGPSILEDVLSIMDRYKSEDNRCEL